MSHCLFLDRSYLSGELLPALPSQAGSLHCRATTGFVCWHEGRLCKGGITAWHQRVGAATAFSQLSQRTTAGLAWIVLFFFFLSLAR